MAGSRTGTRKRVLDAAADAILDGGIRDVTLDGVAARAGVGRQTLYRHFGRRELFFEAVLVDRFKVVADAVTAVVESSPDFETAVVAGSLETLRLSNADRVYLAIAEAERELHLDLLMLGQDTALARQFLQIWRPAFERARKDDVLRPALTVERGAEWLRNAHFLLAHRTDLDANGHARMLRDFVLPGLIATRP